MSQFTDIAIENTTMEVAPVAPEVPMPARRELCRLFAYFASEGITTYDQLAEEMKRWGIMIHTDDDFPGEFKLCHGSKTNHSAPMYRFSNGAVLEKVVVEGEETRFKMIAYNYDIMNCNEGENSNPETISTALHPELVGVSQDNTADLIAQIPGVRITIFKKPNGEVRITTTRMLDAFKAVWNGSNFGVQTRETFDVMYLSLFGCPFDWSLINFNYTYTFLLNHPDNSKEIYHPVPVIYLIGVRDMASFRELDVLHTNEHGFSVYFPGIRPLPHMNVSLSEAATAEADGLSSFQTIVERLNESYEEYGPDELPIHRASGQEKFVRLPKRGVTPDVTGFILRVKDADGVYAYQVFNSPAFKRRTALFGNPKSTLFQFMEMRREDHLNGTNKLAEFQREFPHMVPLHNRFEHNIKSIANEIYEIYCAMYIPECKPKNEAGEILSIHLPKFLRRTVDDLKKLYYELNREAIEKRLKTPKKKITVNHVLGNISKFDPPLLLSIYNGMMNVGSVPVTLKSLLETATVFDPSAPRAGAGNA